MQLRELLQQHQVTLSMHTLQQVQVEEEEEAQADRILAEPLAASEASPGEDQVLTPAAPHLDVAQPDAGQCGPGSKPFPHPTVFSNRTTGLLLAASAGFEARKEQRMQLRQHQLIHQIQQRQQWQLQQQGEHHIHFAALPQPHPAGSRHMPAQDLLSAPGSQSCAGISSAGSATAELHDGLEHTGQQMKGSTEDTHEADSGCSSICSTSSTSGKATFALESTSSERLTTIMVRNVPVRYSRALLMKEWPNNGSYDYLYLPLSASGRNLSYAFINFTSEAHAQAFKEKWQKKRMPLYSSKKALNISAAHLQGLDANLAQNRDLGSGSASSGFPEEHVVISSSFPSRPGFNFQ